MKPWDRKDWDTRMQEHMDKEDKTQLWNMGFCVIAIVICPLLKYFQPHYLLLFAKAVVITYCIRLIAERVKSHIAYHKLLKELE